MSIVTIPEFLYPSLRAGSPGNSIVVDAAEEFFVVVMKVQDTGTLNKIGWKTGTITAGTSFVLKISIETVAETVGQPVATTNAGKTLYAAGAESADITVLSTNTIYYTAINSTTGVAVTAGDDIAITFRLTAVDGASIGLALNQYGNIGSLTEGRIARNSYGASYLGSSWAIYPYYQPISLEYSNGFHPHPGIIPISDATTVAFNSTSDPDRRGAKFKFPLRCRLSGVMVKFDADTDTELILYDSDEYTVMTGFPVTISSTKRSANTTGEFLITFLTKPELESNTFYRMVLLPKTSTNIVMSTLNTPDDSSILGSGNYVETTSLSYTTFNGAPSSESHSWTDTVVKPQISFLIDGIDIGGGSLIGPSVLIGG